MDFSGLEQTGKDDRSRFSRPVPRRNKRQYIKCLTTSHRGLGPYVGPYDAVSASTTSARRAGSATAAEPKRPSRARRIVKGVDPPGTPPIKTPPLNLPWGSLEKGSGILSGPVFGWDPISGGRIFLEGQFFCGDRAALYRRPHFG